MLYLFWIIGRWRCAGKLEGLPEPVKSVRADHSQDRLNLMNHEVRFILELVGEEGNVIGEVQQLIKVRILAMKNVNLICATDVTFQYQNVEYEITAVTTRLTSQAALFDNLPRL